jgi:iron(III) transport system substrate-binding protein
VHRLSSIARRLAVLLASLAVSSAFAQGEVNVVCSAPIAWCEATAAAFRRTTGVDVNLTLKGAGDAVAQIAYERADPKHDLWFGGAGDQHLQAADVGLTEEYKSPLLPQLHDWAVRQAEQSRWHTVALHAGVLGIAYNSDLLAKKKQRAPECWRDLARPEYRDVVQMGDPHSSASAYAAIATLVQLFGEEDAFDLLAAIHRNVREYRRAEAGPMRAVARGEAMIAVTFLHDAVTEIVNGFPIKLVVPCEGIGYELGSMSIVKGAPNLDNAKRLYDWALTPAAQQIGGDTRNFQMPSNKATPMPRAASMMSEIRLAPNSFAAYGTAERRRLLARWDRDVRALPR